jgi:hypothetical protein
MSDILEQKATFLFRALTEDAVLVALDDHSPNNAVAAEVNRLVMVYVEAFQYRPDHIQNLRPIWPIETVALRLASNYF